jgi:hypothetical protein
MKTQIRLARRSPTYWRVTFDNAPLNIFGPEAIPQLNEIITALETDDHVNVVVFDSAVEGFFLTHYNFLAKLEDTTRLPPRPTGLQPLPALLVRSLHRRLRARIGKHRRLYASGGRARREKVVARHSFL